ncbi:MAG: aspartate-semialdehyde dehydrogenase [Bacteroidetes bacterium]|nr:aspartate-semialdehyde dehydrogenase [Bacteroidota bacterium]MCY4206033.1 aspartate-semialdehyde dehydrogenase [Bacteroidota bacterium]
MLRAGILGATGAVGQKFVELLDGHPWFETTALVASGRSTGRQYREAVNWIGATEIPASVASMDVLPLGDDLPCDFVFSGLHASIADQAEPMLARAGYPVISNAKSFRMHSNVPLLIPEVNPDHTSLIKVQDWQSQGYIVTNPNCSTVGLTCALKPLHDTFGVNAVQVTTMQALSGAGYPGVPSLDALANIVPFIGGEEDKLVHEPNKLLGTLVETELLPASITISAQCNRVPVLEGHMECVSVKLESDASKDEVHDAFESSVSPIADLHLPSEPKKFLHVFEDERFPQPRQHSNLGAGMTVSIGRIRSCEVLDYKFVVLSHNTVRGAAGGAILNAELLMKQGLLGTRNT